VRFFDPRTAGTFAAGYLWIHRDDIPDEDVLKAELTRESENSMYYLYQETATHIIVPRHYTADWLPAHPVYTARGEPLPRFHDNVTSFLDEEQERAWEALRDAREGLFVLAGGRGKSVLGVKKICHDGVCATITATMGLLKQWEEHLVHKAGIPKDDIGWVQGSRVEVGKPILLISQDTLMLRPHAITPDARDYYGLHIFDECHHFSSARYSQIPPAFRGRRIGLTATPDGSDERERFVRWIFGPMIYRSSYHSLKATVLIKELPFFRLTKEDVTDRRGEFSFPLTWKHLARDKGRNRLILEDIAFYNAQGRRIIVLTNNVWHAELLHQQIKGSGLLIGSVKKERRKAEFAKPIVVATAQLAAEGLDEPELDTLILAMPFGAKGKLKQSFYRILRDMGQKAQPLVVVYQDPFPPLEALCGKIRGVAHEKGYQVKYADIGPRLEGVHEVPPLRDAPTSRERRRIMPSIPLDLGFTPRT